MPDSVLIFVGAYFVGLGLNLTPCVYPMLAITASLFGSRLAQEPQNIRLRKALIYVLGMATMYSSLGVAASLTGAFFGGALQNRWVLLVISAVLFLMSLSMFGVYTLRAPGRLLSQLTQKREAGYLGFYLSGLFVGLFAAPCIGPPIIALLTIVGAKGNPVFAFFLFFIMAFGLGTPYLIFGVYSDWVKKLPKSGVWLVWVERLFGFALLMLALFYLMLAFIPVMAGNLLPVALVTGGIYLGFVENAGNELKIFKWVKKVLCVIALLAGLNMMFAVPKQIIDWEPYRAQKIEAAKEAAQPVILDFFADWCIPCLELDRWTYTDPRVKESLEGFLKIKIDLTDPGEKEEALVEKYRVLGVPTFVFLNRQGEEIRSARVTGFVDAEELLEIIRQVEPA